MSSPMWTPIGPAGEIAMTDINSTVDAAARDAKTAAHDVSAEAKSVVNDVTQQAKSVANDAKETIKSEVTARADAAKGAAAQEVNNVASALRKAANESRTGSPQERTFGQIADTLADASDAISNKDLGTAISDVGHFARRNPLVFLAGAALAGFAVSRFAKASERNAGGMAAQADYHGSDDFMPPRHGNVDIDGRG
ncbi:hypothetical protein [Loktanella salsilacus]|uniref:hypothetical protein n=1 Tax=Loktanella salsilacus TaxID=195913 RepID=UPI0037354F94